MELGLAGKVAIVSGASKGIGLAVVRGLVANVVVSPAATWSCSCATRARPTFCRNGVSSHPPMPQAMP